MTTYCANLEQEALLHLTGPDAMTFLQGQVTCDTRLIDADHALLGAYCTPQGRVVCDFLLCQLAEQHYALRLRRDIRSSSAATFGKYIVFSKAELDDQRDDWQLLGCWGTGAASALQGLFGEVPNEYLGACSGEGYVLVQTDEEGTQFECYLETARHLKSLERLGEQSESATENQWQALQIQRGVGRVEAATVGEFIPQMLNYDLTGHISFKKGCYTGQEVVARLHYRGKPKRRMYLAKLTGKGQATAGAGLYTSGGTGQSVGNIVNVAATSGESALTLVVATVAGVEAGLHLDSPEGSQLAMGKLPYSTLSE